jgi:hypothetical protein
MERFFSKKINLIYFGKWRDLGSLTYNSPLQGQKKKKKRKKDPMHELTIHHLGKARYAHCSMQAHFWGPKCFF